MPGILAMNPSGAEGPAASRDGEAKKRTHDGRFVNGERNATARDVAVGAPAVTAPAAMPGANGASLSTSGVPSTLIPAHMAQEPPAIPHLDSSNYFALSKLLARISQECFNDLNQALQKMADVSASYPPNRTLPNGNSVYGVPNGVQENPELSKQKKLILMRFAQDSRAKFIKLLVLTEWGKKSSVDVSKLIDIFSWTRGQSAAMDEVDVKIERLKILSSQARQYNPDIRTALEILANQKAGWIPDMSFIPAEPIPSENALKLLRYIDSSLSIRLTVHENLPRHLQKWRVESGRATFIIDGEFEFDVMSFVEDLSDQWLFIDLRLLFSPAPSINVNSRFMHELKFTLDSILGSDGLGECFNYLHNFTLTHKINVLRSQAYQLIRAGWAGSLRIDQPHRALVIQYWTDKPGKKSWIEIGISSNRPANGKVSWRGQPIPSLTARWFRQGVEVKDVDLGFDWTVLSTERMVKRAIALHTMHLLQGARRHLHSNVSVNETLSETEPSDCMLEASLGTTAVKTTLSIEPVTGRYILRPVTPLSSGAENAINRVPEIASTSNTITQLLARSVLDLVQRYAQQLGWQQVARQALRIDAVKAAVKRDALQYALYWPSGWSPEWALATIVEASGESWWVFEMASNGSVIKYAQRIEMEKPGGSLSSLDRSVLSSIERIAVHTIAFYVTARELGKQNKAYGLRDEFAQPRPTATSQDIVRGWALLLSTADLLPSKTGDSPWLEPTMRVTCQGLRMDSRKIWHIASGTMVPAAATDMKKLMSASPQNNFNFSEDGRFSILLCTPFGQEMVTELKARLRDVDRLRSFAAVLQKRRMPLRSSSLKEVQFQYGKTLTATVTFGDGSDIKVDFGANNPHKRIHSLLTELINRRCPALEGLLRQDNTDLDRFCTTLMLTRPILSALSEIERQNCQQLGNPWIYAHAIEVYRLTYVNPTCSFDIRLRPKDDRVMWLIEDNEEKPVDLRPKGERIPNFKRPEALKTALSKLFKESGERWFGVRKGIVAEVDGIPGALKRLHETVVSCYDPNAVQQEGDGSGGTGEGAPAQGTAGEGTNKTGDNKSTNGTQRPPIKPSNMGGSRPPGGNNREVITID